MLIDPSFKVPATATATIEPVNLFGAEQVSITSPDDNSDAGPYLAAGGSSPTPRAATSWATSSPPPPRCSTRSTPTTCRPSWASCPRRPRARAPRSPPPSSAGTQLAGLLDRTLNAQIAGARLLRQVHPGDRAGGRRPQQPQRRRSTPGLPAFNAEETDYENLLNTLIPFSNRLASLLSTYHPDIATILRVRRQRVAGAAGRSRTTIGQVVNGAYHYFQKIAEGASGLNKLPDGSTYAYFNTFILFSDVNSLVCNLIAPPTGGHVVPPADPAGAGRRRLRLQLLVAAGHVQRAADHRRAATPPRLRPPARRRVHLAHRRRPTQRRRSRGQPGLRHHRPAGHVQAHDARRASSTSCSGARREAAAGTSRRRPSSSPSSPLVCLVLLVGLAVKIGNISLFSSRHTVDAQLTDVTGLAGGDDVNIAGVPVGQVTSIGVQHGHALIAMSINNTVTLRRPPTSGCAGRTSSARRRSSSSRATRATSWRRAPRSR